MPDFSKRSTDLEIMDDLTCRGEVVNQTLRELEFINRWLGGNGVTLQAVMKLARAQEVRTLHIADLGCGGGDMLILIAQWGRKNKIPLLLSGIDANPNIIEYARTNCADFPEISLEVLDIFSPEFAEKKFDIVIGTLFYHHFASPALSDFFSRLARQVQVGIVVNDIHRHWLAYYSIRMLTRLFSRSAMVRFDAPLSVLRAFTRKDLETILLGAGISTFELRWKWAFRWQALIPANHALER